MIRDGKILPDRKTSYNQLIMKYIIHFFTPTVPCSILFFFLLPFFSLSQTSAGYSSVDKIASSVPDSAEMNISSLSDYFISKFTSKKDLLRAIYVWTAKEINYDVENMFNPKPITNRGKLIMEILQTRKAVCQGYAEVFSELCSNCNIECYVIQGVTKQNHVVMQLSHTWILARPDTGWFFFDPTWGSGFVNNGIYTKKLTDEHFMIPPQVNVKTRMPFDPLWQCLYYPLTVQEFYGEKKPKPEANRYFSFPDSIRAYQNTPVADRYESILRRVEANGIYNNNTGEYIRMLRQNAEVEKNNREILLRNGLSDRFNKLVKLFNDATFRFNDYINYWNKHFKPARPDQEIRLMMDSVAGDVNRCRTMLKGISPRDESLRQNMESLDKAIVQLQKQIESHQAFLREYFATPKSSRPKLFQTWRF